MSKRKNSFFEEDGSVKKRIDAGTFKIASAKENEDGTTTFAFEYDEAFAEYYKIKTGEKEVSEEGINNFILKILEERDSGEDNGYDLKKVKEESKVKFFKKYNC